MTQAEILEKIMARLPYPEQVKNLSLAVPSAVQFEWRNTVWCVRSTGGVDEVDGQILKGTNAAILLQALLFGRP